MAWLKQFKDREEAGQRLAERLEHLRGDAPVLLALPRGGVVVGAEVARALGVPLEVLVVRKLGVPWQRELGMGALAEGGALYLNPEVLQAVDVSEEELQAVARQEAQELERRVRLYRGERPLPELRGRTVVLVDDGLATGGTARAAARAVREAEPRRVVLAVPVAAVDTIHALRGEVDEVVAVEPTEWLGAVGAWYEDFHQVTDAEVLELLGQPRSAAPA